jgi:hypothetical protein
VVWRSGPAGRGTVTERVVERLALEGQTVEVRDDSIKGHQRVAFLPEDDGVEITLSLEYELARRTLFTPLVDLLFIRKAFERSLSNTLERFAAELRTVRRTTLG